MPPLSLPRLYAILDPAQTAGRHPIEVLRELSSGGVGIVQLRVKIMSPREFLALARESRALMQDRGCKVIVNDRVDIALASDADGVHLGQEDLPLGPARKLMPQKIIGVSTHSIEQAKDAERAGADYIGFGPMFGTATKDTGYTARGIDMLREVRAAVKIPIVGIGGITEANVSQVWQAGADSAAIISDILGADDIPAKVRRIL
ncbi:MAG: thiamine phosphate synthase, partial [Deltaproteobacteria bacterium]|nr:thiamine phosphate synthase [Deltaproteobacteria bacterium]